MDRLILAAGIAAFVTTGLAGVWIGGYHGLDMAWGNGSKQVRRTGYSLALLGFAMACVGFLGGPLILSGALR